MDPETQNIIKKQMEKLPTEIRKLFSDTELNNKILTIGKTNGLTAEQIGILQLEIDLVLLGLVYVDDFPNELEENLKIDSVKLDNITNDTSIQIFRKIRVHLQEVYEKTNEDLEEKNSDWEENIGFILSGGDYSNFTEGK
ncbi:MAG TPA: hypothetical protein VGO21_02390 [Candidatus Paceibacterota bacterium]|jgi:hypothetical protein|nr:hypothetical protein [Candidatus Paceibacterota bacterium]